MARVRVGIRGIIGFILAVVMLVLLVAPRTGTAGSTGKLHPYLNGQLSSDNFVDVIVATSPGASVKQIELETGGKVVRNWPFINAAQVRMVANKLSALIQDSGVKYVSPNSQTKSTVAYDVTKIASRYQASLKVQKFWAANYFGQGVGVAVLDSGVATVPALAGRTVNVVLDTVGSWDDVYGHGTHVAGIIAGDAGDGLHVGVAPKATIYNVKVTDDSGNASEADILSGLEWVYNNYQANNIRVVNMSMQASLASDYAVSPICAAVERLWAAGVVVVVSSGNRGQATQSELYPPANDPYVITVGAMDDRGTSSTADDVVLTWSSQGKTPYGQMKPEVLAPGRGLLSTLAPGSSLANRYPQLVQAGGYITLSGSSMAAPTIAGSVALMLNYQPTLKPDQVKYALMNYRRTVQGQVSGGPAVPIEDKMFDGISTPSAVKYANVGLKPSIFLTEDPTRIAEILSQMSAYDGNVFFLNINPDAQYFDQ